MVLYFRLRPIVAHTHFHSSDLAYLGKKLEWDWLQINLLKVFSALYLCPWCPHGHEAAGGKCEDDWALRGLPCLEQPITMLVWSMLVKKTTPVAVVWKRQVAHSSLLSTSTSHMLMMYQGLFMSPVEHSERFKASGSFIDTFRLHRALVSTIRLLKSLYEPSRSSGGSFELSEPSRASGGLYWILWALWRFGGLSQSAEVSSQHLQSFWELYRGLRAL